MIAKAEIFSPAKICGRTRAFTSGRAARTIGGAPIDFHAGGPAIIAAMNCFAPGGDLALYRSLVEEGGGMLDGRHLLNGFIAMQPQAEVGRQLALLAHIDDAAHVARYREFEDWFKYTQPIPGAFYL